MHMYIRLEEAPNIASGSFSASKDQVLALYLILFNNEQECFDVVRY